MLEDILTCKCACMQNILNICKLETITLPVQALCYVKTNNISKDSHRAYHNTFRFSSSLQAIIINIKEAAYARILRQVIAFFFIKMHSY